MDRFAAIAAERLAIADLLDTLNDDQWETQSCCGAWTIEDVAAHLTVVWNYTALDYLKRSMRNRATWFKPQDSLAAINAATSRRFALFSNRRLLDGLSFRATDIDWRSGSGPEVAGPASHLAHAMWGRSAALSEFTGAGPDVLRTRLTTIAR